MPIDFNRLVDLRHDKSDRSYVYFIQQGGGWNTTTGGPVKIGHASDPEKRLSQLQTGNPEKLHLLAVMPGGEVEERLEHERFGMHRIRGEWFSPVRPVLQRVAALRVRAGQLLDEDQRELSAAMLEAMRDVCLRLEG